MDPRRIAAACVILGAVGTACETTNDATDGTGCDASEISRDLDLPDHQRDAPAEVTECEPSWAVIRWDVPGDSQRMVRRVDGKWQTYVAFPHRECWDAAVHDGVPAAFAKYFPGC